jgi:hypothetical protein
MDVVSIFFGYPSEVIHSMKRTWLVLSEIFENLLPGDREFHASSQQNFMSLKSSLYLPHLG